MHHWFMFVDIKRMVYIFSRQLVVVHMQFCYNLLQYCSLLNWRKTRSRCGFVAVPVNWNVVVISPYFAMFKNVVHSLEHGETPNYSASHQAPNYAHRFLNISKHFKTVAVRLRLIFQFTSVQYCSTCISAGLPFVHVYQSFSLLILISSVTTLY